VEGTAASSQHDHASEFVSVLLILNDHSITPPDRAPDESAYEAQQALTQPSKEAALLTSLDTVQMPTLSGSADGNDANALAAEAAGNEAGHAMLFGRYMGQVKARIERAWEYPLDSSAAAFDCKVQIKQNRQSQVQEVTLQRCGDDPAWQLSVVQAIQRASPLSAPPDRRELTPLIPDGGSPLGSAPYCDQVCDQNNINAGVNVGC
jgi:hypothetical protein